MKFEMYFASLVLSIWSNRGGVYGLYYSKPPVRDQEVFAYLEEDKESLMLHTNTENM